MDEKLNAEWKRQIERFKRNEPIDWEKLKKLEKESRKSEEQLQLIPDMGLWDYLFTFGLCIFQMQLNVLIKIVSELNNSQALLKL